MNILVVEDEKDMNTVICKALAANGYVPEPCFDGKEALKRLSKTTYDAVILDVMLPFVNGFDIVKELRFTGNQIPVLFLTARDTIQDKVTGLDLGGNDYLVKPFSFDELLARLRALTRSITEHNKHILTISDLTLNKEAHTVFRDGQEIPLSSKEFSLLAYLMQNKDVVLSRETIKNQIWSYDYEGGSNIVDVYIRYLRKKIDDPYQQKLIQTIRGFGYVIRGEQ